MHTTTPLQVLSAAELRARSGRKWHDYADDVLPAWIAEMDFPSAEPIQSALRRLAAEAAYGYEPTSMYPRLAEGFASYMQSRFGWQPPVDRDLVVPVADLVQGLFTAVAAFTARGQGVVLQTPIYPPFQHAVNETGRRIVENPLVDDGARFAIDAPGLGTVFDTNAPLLLLCNPHNPTGRVFTRAELERVAALAVERNLVVVADEVHADLTYAATTFVPFASLGPEIAARTVTLTSATKAYNIPGLRCGLMHFGSTELRQRFRTVAPDRSLGIVNQFGIEATIVAWRDCTDWLGAVMEVLSANRTRLTEFLAAELPEVRWYPPEATYLAWLDCSALLPPGTSGQHHFLERARVALSNGADFSPACERHVRLNFATSPQILEDILKRMAASLR